MEISLTFRQFPNQCVYSLIYIPLPQSKFEQKKYGHVIVQWFQHLYLFFNSTGLGVKWSQVLDERDVIVRDYGYTGTSVKDRMLPDLHLQHLPVRTDGLWEGKTHRLSCLMMHSHNIACFEDLLPKG